MNEKIKKYAFLGYGDLSSQILSIFNIDKKNIVIFDDKNSKNQFNSYSKFFNNYNWILGIGYKHLNKKLVIIKKMLKSNCSLPNLIHNSSYISKKSEMLKGVIIYPMCNIDDNVIIKPGVLLNNSTTVSHNTYIGFGTFISPGVVISGNVKIGDGCFIGAGTIISNNVNIGNQVYIGAGSLITNNVNDNSHVIGNPMKIINKKFNLV